MSKEARIWLIGGVLIATVAWLVVLWVPEWMANQFYFKTQKEWFAQVNANRSVIVTLVGGLAVAVTIYFTYQNFKVSQETLKISQENLLTESFSKAVDKLGNTEVSVRLGGIHALSRIARRSKPDYFSIMQILTAHIQTRFSIQKPAAPPSTICDTELQRVLTTIGNRYWPEPENARLDLSYCRVHNAWLPSANFKDIYFWETRMHGVNLDGAILDGADFKDAVLDTCSFTDASLKGANFQGAKILKSIGLTEEQLTAAAFHPAQWTQLGR